PTLFRSAFRYGNTLQTVAKTVFPIFPGMLVPSSRLSRFMAPGAASFDFPKDLIQGRLPNYPLHFSGNGEVRLSVARSILISSFKFLPQISLCFQVFYKVVNGIIFIGETIFLVEFP